MDKDWFLMDLKETSLKKAIIDTFDNLEECIEKLKEFGDLNYYPHPLVDSGNKCYGCVSKKFFKERELRKGIYDPTSFTRYTPSHHGYEAWLAEGYKGNYKQFLDVFNDYNGKIHNSYLYQDYKPHHKKRPPKDSVDETIALSEGYERVIENVGGIIYHSDGIVELTKKRGGTYEYIIGRYRGYKHITVETPMSVTSYTHKDWRTDIAEFPFNNGRCKIDSFGINCSLPHGTIYANRLANEIESGGLIHLITQQVDAYGKKIFEKEYDVKFIEHETTPKHLYSVFAVPK